MDRNVIITIIRVNRRDSCTRFSFETFFFFGKNNNHFVKSEPEVIVRTREITKVKLFQINIYFLGRWSVCTLTSQKKTSDPFEEAAPTHPQSVRPFNRSPIGLKACLVRVMLN